MLFNINDSSLAGSQQTERIVLQFSITQGTGACTYAWNGKTPPPQYLIEGGQGAASLPTITQAAIDSLLGSTNEFIYNVAFGATAMADNNSFGLVLNCGGQVAKVSSAIMYVNIAGTCGIKNGIGTTLAPTNAAASGVLVNVSSLGNIIVRTTYTNISAAASDAGFICLVLDVKFK